MFYFKHLAEFSIGLRVSYVQYEYVLQFHLMAQHDNADALSRLPLPETIDTVSLPGELIRFIDHLVKGPITAAQLKAWRV